MTLIDSHAHYENDRYNQDRNQLLTAMQNSVVELIINVGCNIADSKHSIQLAEEYPHVYASVGVHPHYAKSLNSKMLSELKSFCVHPKVVAYGEIGLDFYHDFSPRDVQRKWFEKQLEAAHEVNLPVVIHSRDANEDVFDIIKNSPIRNGVIHSFSGDSTLAERYVEMGFNLGISGVVTYDKIGKLQNVVNKIPLKHLLLETDAPYLTPVPYRGKRNESQYLVHVAETIATIKGITVEEVCKQTSENTKNLFAKIIG